MRVWLADLTYTQQTIASDVIPAAIGMLAEYAAQEVPEISEIRLFKYPEDLIAAVEERRPDVLAFSNYVWNSALSLALAREIKVEHPELTIVFGGPNFPTVPREQEAVLRSVPWVDYYVTKEAERGFAQLLSALFVSKFDKSRISGDVANLCYLAVDGTFRSSPRVERVLNLEAIPSPYLSGRLDAFFDGRLLPVIQTARGCPFTCAFCTEGQQYWNKVKHKPQTVVRDEIIYIAERLAELQQGRRRTDLLIADSNFGMFPQDLDTCRVIAETQDRFDYPKYINVATGKNKKERILEAAKLVRGAMKLAGSVQSLDPIVQQKMRRQNISADQIMSMAIQSSEIGTNTYSEVILGLPGDSIQAHFKTLQTLVDAGFNTISMYQLMMLVGTEFGSDEVKRTYEMVLKYRVVPRCFGSFQYRGHTINVAEIEEICVANSTLPYEDYLKCRKMNLIVNVFYNDGVFSEIIRFFKILGLSPWGWFLRIHECTLDREFDELVDMFLAETEGELWNDRGELQRFIESEGVISRHISGELGSNLIFKYKALSLTRYFAATCRVAMSTLQDFLSEKMGDPSMRQLAGEIIAYKRLQVEGLFDAETMSRCAEFRFDVSGIAKAADAEDLIALAFESPRFLTFVHSEEQQRSIASYVGIFGNDTRGLTRILSRVFLKQLFRQPVDRFEELNYRGFLGEEKARTSPSSLSE
jgi:radical SAM superfamily enzyme YgiQ (UPF0313 family)